MGKTNINSFLASNLVRKEDGGSTESAPRKSVLFDEPSSPTPVLLCDGGRQRRVRET